MRERRERLLNGGQPLGARKNEEMLAAARPVHLPVDFFVFAKAGQSIGLPSRQRVGRVEFGHWEQQVGGATFVLVDDVHVGWDRGADFDEEPVARSNPRSRSQSDFLPIV